MKLIILFIMILNYMDAQFQMNHYYTGKFAYGIGLNTQNILGTPLAKKPLRNLIDRGGSFSETQSGIELRFTYYIDSSDKFRIPFGSTFMFYNAKEALVFTTERLGFSNSLNFSTVFVGFHYSFAKFYWANARPYAGIELNANMVSGHTFIYDYKNFLDSKLDTRTETDIDSKFRFGTTFRLGTEAELNKEIMVNISLAYQIFNIFQRENNFTQLLSYSPSVVSIKNEELIQALSLTFIIQYRL